jgi:CDP-diacylglycerol--glycerol-3-phosphate 3-phosphatidyltransferase
MITVSNALSFVRGPLALLFWQASPTMRFVLIFLAMLTDSIDGYLARRNKSVSQFGAFLDPAMDKFFVFSALSAFLVEDKITAAGMMAMLSRDFFVFLYGLIIALSGRWKTIVFRALSWGKITTALQFIVLMCLCFDVSIPWYIFGAFMAMGVMAFLELFQIAETPTSI